MFRPAKPTNTAAPQGRTGLQVKIGELVQRGPVTVTSLDTIARGMQVMADEKVGSLIVLAPEHPRPIGIVTLRDILCRVALPRIDIGQSISVVMTPDPISVSKDTSTHQAALLMAKRELHHLLITDEKGCLLGVVSNNDIYDLLCTSCAAVRRAKATAGIQPARPRETSAAR